MFNKNNKERKMKKIFQLRDYLNWNEMTLAQKINFKRACLFPFLVYVAYAFLYKYSMAILILICIYYLVRFINRKSLKK